MSDECVEVDHMNLRKTYEQFQLVIKNALEQTPKFAKDSKLVHQALTDINEYIMRRIHRK
jgi:hypothetical protein